MAAKHMFPYIMANKNSHPVFYTGITNNLIRRVQEHKMELLKGFTQKYHLHNLVYYEIVEGQELGIIREKQIKNLSRKEKLELISSINPTFKDLYYEMCRMLQ